MADRNVKVTVRADVADFLRNTGLAADAAGKLGEASKKAGETGKRGLSGLAQQVRDNREAWSTTGGALTTYGAAVTGLTAIVAKTGIEYNTLRQTSVAALTTLTGSAEAANAQMAKLDEFASNSPFSRQTFIQAQQQLLGFGMEAERVLPTLDAIQNAVAAFGGSNQDIAEVAFVIAQVGAAGKITAQDLMQLGQRGIDAAGLIGSQMGKTGAQIREEITEGALGADEAIQMLVAGMDQRFGGAAANVKSTFAGALDRVKAAFRDISASATGMLVDPQGGGLLVDGFNRLADALRAFEDIPGPIRNTALAVGALSGVAALAAGSFFLLAPRAVDTWDALGKMGTVGPRVQTGLSNVGTMAARVAGPLMLGALLVTLSKVGQSMLDTGESAEVLEARLRSMASGHDFDGSIFSRGAEIEDFGAALREIGDDSLWGGISRGVTDTVDGFLAFITAGKDGRTEATKLRHDLPRLDLALSSLAATSRDDAAAALAELTDHYGLNRREVSDLIDELPAFRDGLVTVATELGLNADRATLLAIATGEIKPAADEAAEGTDGLSESAQALAEVEEEAAAHAEALAEAFRTWTTDIGTASSAFASIEGALSSHISKTQEWAQEQAAATETADDSWQDFYDGHSVNLAEYLDELQSQVDAQREWQQNIEALVGRVSQGTLDHLARLGPEGAPLVAALVDGTDEELARFDQLFLDSGVAAGIQWAAGLAASQSVYNAAARELGHEAALEIVNAIAAGETTAAQAVLDYNLETTLEVMADTDPAAAELLNYVAQVEEQVARAKVDADTSLAIGGVETWVYDTNTKMPRPRVDADTSLATTASDRWERRTALLRPTPRINADNSPATSVARAWELGVRAMFPFARVGANDGPARSTARGLQGWINSLWSTVNVTARYAGGLNMGGADRTRYSARASGGVERRPMMMGPGYGPTNVILAGEPSTNGEAFISNHPNFRRENEQYLRIAAGWFGMDLVKAYAAGGVARSSSASAHTAGTVTAVLAPEDRALLTAVAARPVQLEANGQVMARVVAAGRAELGGRLNTAGGRR